MGPPASGCELVLVNNTCRNGCSEGLMDFRRQVAGGWGGRRGQNNTPKETPPRPQMELSGRAVSTRSRRMTAQCVETGKVEAEEASEK